LNQIAAAATRRALADAGRNIVALAGDQKNKVADALTSAESEVLGLRGSGVRSSATPLSALIPDVLKTLESRKAGELLGLSSGLASLDDANGGLKEQELVIIAARPGMGKSVLALQMARDIAARDGRCYFASYEMSGTELTARLLSREIQAPAQAILRNDLDLDANLRLADAARALSQVDLVVDDAPPSDVTGLVAHIRSQHARSPFTAVFVDYLQLIDGRGTSRVEQITYVSRQLKLLAVALGIPVVALSQLSRNLESRPDKRPILSDLRDSGAIEQDANQVLAIYRPSLYESDADDADAELLVLKNRSGVPGITVKTEFHGAWSLFRDIGSAATKTVRTALASGGGGWGGNTSPF
ncbi:MAG: AAA family ATPase, partial [Actinomycetia bacterium]|nr:AAA family ATPase [Actinomycetes bacterium]